MLIGTGNVVYNARKEIWQFKTLKF